MKAKKVLDFTGFPFFLDVLDELGCRHRNAPGETHHQGGAGRSDGTDLP